MSGRGQFFFYLAPYLVSLLGLFKEEPVHKENFSLARDSNSSSIISETQENNLHYSDFPHSYLQF